MQQVQVVTVRPVSAPPVDEQWHSLAQDWFRSLGRSGQSAYYQPSDWSTARVWAELLSRQLLSPRVSAQMVAAWAAGATELLTTEGARRRLRLELVSATEGDEDQEAADAAVLKLVRELEEGPDGA